MVRMWMLGADGHVAPATGVGRKDTHMLYIAYSTMAQIQIFKMTITGT
jgi:hypothetical protein